MATNLSSSAQETPETREFKLIPARLDFNCVKTQLAIAGVLALVACAAIYGGTLQIGFLSTDYLVLRAISASSQAGVSQVWDLITSSRLAQSYGFVPMVSLLLDWLIWHGHSTWYHFENLILLGFSAFVVAQLTAQLATLQGTRLGPVAGIWAALLFCLYPAHSEITSWIAARAQLLLLVFYLLSVFCYLRFRLLREKGYLWLCLVSSGAAYLSGALSWSLPLVITLAELLLFGQNAVETAPRKNLPAGARDEKGGGAGEPLISTAGNVQTSALTRQEAPTPHSSTSAEQQTEPEEDLAIAQLSTEDIAAVEQMAKEAAARVSTGPSSNMKTLRIVAPVFCWAVMFFATTLGMVAPNAVPLSTLMEFNPIALADLAQPAVLISIAMPLANESSLPAGTQEAAQVLIAVLFSLAAVVILVRAVRNAEMRSTFIWLLLWLVFAVGQATGYIITQQKFAVGHLLYLAGAPLAILLSLACLPAAGALKRSEARISTSIGIALLIGIGSFWTWLVGYNVRPWLLAGHQMQQFRHAMQVIGQRINAGADVVLTNLPPPRQGLSLFPDSYTFQAALAPPFAARDYTSRLSNSNTASNSVSLRRTFVWPGLINRQLASAGGKQEIFQWDDTQQQYIGYKGSSGNAGLEASFNEATIGNYTCEPKPGTTPEERMTAGPLQKATVTPLKDMCRIFPGKTGITIWLPAVRLDPMKATAAGIKILYTSKTGCHTCSKNDMRLVWEASLTPGSPSYKARGEATIFNQSFGQYVVWVGRYPAWALANSIERVGLRFMPGDYYADIQTLDILSALRMQPQLFVRDSSGKVAGASMTPFRLKAGTKADLLFDASKVPGAAGVKLAISSGDASYTTDDESLLYEFKPSTGKELFNSDFPSVHSIAAIPGSLMNLPGEYKIRAAALDRNASIIGLPSEPFLVLVDK